MEFKQKGFTLIELIIVIAIIALLAAATFVAVNPAKRMGNANDAQRWADVTAIADAVNLYVADNTGSYPSNLVADTLYEVNIYGNTCATDACADQSDNANSFVDLDELVDDGFIGKLPSDPGSSDANCTDYWIQRTTAGSGFILEVGSCASYGDAISLTR